MMMNARACQCRARPIHRARSTIETRRRRRRTTMCNETARNARVGVILCRSASPAAEEESSTDAFMSDGELEALEAELRARGGDKQDELEWEVPAYVVNRHWPRDAYMMLSNFPTKVNSCSDACTGRELTLPACFDGACCWRWRC